MSTPVSPEMGDNVLGFLKRSASAPGSDHLSMYFSLLLF